MLARRERLGVIPKQNFSQGGICLSVSRPVLVILSQSCRNPLPAKVTRPLKVPVVGGDRLFLLVVWDSIIIEPSQPFRHIPACIRRWPRSLPLHWRSIGQTR